jgi:hypothetical protein
MLLRLNDNTLQFFEDWELFISRVNPCITLLFGMQKTDLFQPAQFALDITGVFLDQLSQTADMRPKIWIFGIDDNYLTTHPRGNEYIKHLAKPLSSSLVCSVAFYSTFFS